MTFDRDKLAAVVRDGLDDAKLCTRVWEAWSHGTMSDSDFSLAAEDDAFVHQITDAVIAHLSTVPVEGEVEWEYRSTLSPDLVLEKRLVAEAWFPPESIQRRRKAGQWEKVTP